MYNIYAISLGCPKNRVDTEHLLAALPFQTRMVPELDQADLVLINTCSFIQPAVEESVRTILETAADLADPDSGRQRPKLVVAGCLPARYSQELDEAMPEVDLWLPPDSYDTWPQAFAHILGAAPDAKPPVRAISTPPGYAYLKIGEGCNHACSYCTIPSIRGPLQSIPLRELVRESSELLQQGVSELVLVAQDVCAYGRDLPEGQDLQQLITSLLSLDGLQRLRLMYLYPTGITESFMDFLAQAGPKFVPYFDVPLQHVHPEILAAMGRPKSDPAATVIQRIRSRFPNAAIRSTFIVGYPGETEEHFNYLLDFIRIQRLMHVGVFPFSPEEGTPAALLPFDDEAAQTALARQEAIMQVQAEISAELLADFDGERLDILVDSPHEEWPELYIGRTWFQAPEVDGVTYVSGPDVKPGALVSAEIVESKTYDLVALA